MQTSDDTAMLSELKQGNLKAYQYFFLKYYKPLCLKAYQMLGDMERARDTVQQAFIEVWKNEAYMDIQQSVGGFFYQLVHQQCKQLQLGGATTATAAEQQGEACPPCQAGAAVVPLAPRMQVITALEQLPADQRNRAVQEIALRYGNL